MHEENANCTVTESENPFYNYRLRKTNSVYW